MTERSSEMVLLKGTIDARSPLHLGTGRALGTFLPTLPYIPGRMLRGMLGYYLYKKDRELFESSCIDEDHDLSKMGVIIRNAYPESRDGTRTIIPPLYMRWCKRCGRRIPGGADECQHIDEESGMPCLHEGRKSTEFVSETSLREMRLNHVTMPERRIETKCPITRDHHASPGGRERGFELSPYHIESLEKGSRFALAMLVREEIQDSIKNAFERACRYAGVGGFRSRGYGLISVTWNDSMKLSDLIQKRAGELSANDGAYIVANAPMILRQGDTSIIGFDGVFLAYAKSTLKAVGLSEEISYAEKDGNPMSKGFVTSTYARGWSFRDHNTLAELIPCMGAGSCVRVRASPQALATLEAYGAGEMISSGYGEIYIHSEEAGR